MPSHPQRQYGLDDYHRIEETSPVRHELHNGEIFAMAGGSVAHNHISANVLSLLRLGLIDTPCSAFGSDMRLFAPAGLLTYPDAMVICGNIELVPGRVDEVTNPILLVEVLSDATRNYDRGDKLTFYKSIPSFREYLLIEQKQPEVEHHVRDHTGTWTSRVYRSTSDAIKLTSPPLAIELRLSEVYRRVFDPA